MNGSKDISLIFRLHKVCQLSVSMQHDELIVRVVLLDLIMSSTFYDHVIV